MQTSKAIVKFIAELVVVLGSLSCILVWLEIKPKDLQPLTLPHLLWLLLALFLYGITLASSGYSLWKTSMFVNDLRTDHASQLQKQQSQMEAEFKLREELIDKRWRGESAATNARQEQRHADELEQRVGSLAAALPSSTGLVIHSAIYGFEGSGVADITNKVRGIAASGQWRVPVQHDILGIKDPCPGVPKKLILKFSFSDTIQAHEGGPELSLPIHAKKTEAINSLMALRAEFLKLMVDFPEQTPPRQPFVVDWRPSIGETSFGDDKRRSMAWHRKLEEFLNLYKNITVIRNSHLANAFQGCSHIPGVLGPIPLLEDLLAALLASSPSVGSNAT